MASTWLMATQISIATVWWALMLMHDVPKHFLTRGSSTTTTGDHSFSLSLALCRQQVIIILFIAAPKVPFAVVAWFTILLVDVAFWHGPQRWQLHIIIPWCVTTLTWTNFVLIFFVGRRLPYIDTTAFIILSLQLAAVVIWICVPTRFKQETLDNPSFLWRSIKHVTIVFSLCTHVVAAIVLIIYRHNEHAVITSVLIMVVARLVMSTSAQTLVRDTVHVWLRRRARSRRQRDRQHRGYNLFTRQTSSLSSYDPAIVSVLNETSQSSDSCI